MACALTSIIQHLPLRGRPAADALDCQKPGLSCLWVELAVQAKSSSVSRVLINNGPLRIMPSDMLAETVQRLLTSVRCKAMLKRKDFWIS